MTRNPRRESLKDAAIYRKAAKFVEEGSLQGCMFGYACNAIEYAVGTPEEQIFPYDREARKDSLQAAAFKKVFSPGWSNEQGFFGAMEKESNRDRRVVALCFMAAMVEAGDA